MANPVERKTTGHGRVGYDGAMNDTTPPRQLRDILALEDFEPAARRYLPRPLFGYVSGAAETNASFRDNRAVYDEYEFVCKTLVNTSQRSQQATLFGKTYSAPFGICPMGMAAIIAYRGDIMLARAAAAEDIPMILAGSSLIRLEDVKREGHTAWFQAYLPGDQARIDALVERVAAAGYDTLVITVDTPVAANRENNTRNGFTTPLRPGLRLAWQGITHPRWTVNTFLRTLVKHGMPHFENSFATRGVPIVARNVMRDFSAKDHLNWSHIEAIRRNWKGNLLLKGIVDRGDAKTARGIGIDGLIVSNHGGRQLDGVVTPLRVLPGIVEAVPGMPVLMDSGVRRGSDVLKALALGARMVFVGRPFMYAAAIGEEAAVRHGIGLLKEEVSRNMAMLGVNCLAEMTAAKLMRTRG
ncbi:MAG: alpha-hydroxy acid oxidase [Usitatibacter sp.]